jgi:type VI secretion system secreted protein Hcp
MTATAPTSDSKVNMVGYHTLMTVKDIAGYSKFSKDAIDLKSFEFTVGHGLEAGKGEQLTSGRLALSGVAAVKNVDKATPLLFQALTQNTNITEVGIFLYRNGADGKEENWMTLTLTNVVVANQKFVDPDKEKGGEALALEEINFQCEKFEISHNPAKKVASYQFTTGKRGA